MRTPDTAACRRYAEEHFDCTRIAQQVLVVYREAADVRLRRNGGQ